MEDNIKIISVRLKKTGKIYYYKTTQKNIKISDMVIIETERGTELARVVKVLKNDVSKFLEENKDIKNIIKIATKQDLITQKENEKEAEVALKFCKEEVIRLKLNMKVLLAEYTFDGTKLLFYFVSDDRVDFRELVKNLAYEFKVRIELRQIGARDEIKMHSNLGICGREVCCRSYLQDFDSVTIKLAKEQGLQINMTKLSGACGKLKCCLRYEEEVYKENMSKLPKVGQMVSVYNKEKSKEETGKVVGVDIIKLLVRVKISNDDEERYDTLRLEDIKIIN